MLLKISQISKKKPVLESRFNKVADLKVCNIIEKRLRHRCFPAKFAKFLRRPFFTGHLWQLLLFIIFLYDLFLLIKDFDFATYADNNTTHMTGHTSYYQPVSVVKVNYLQKREVAKNQQTKNKILTLANISTTNIKQARYLNFGHFSTVSL